MKGGGGRMLTVHPSGPQNFPQILATPLTCMGTKFCIEITQLDTEKSKGTESIRSGMKVINVLCNNNY
mgnify:CR=1 FL=1